MHALEIYAEQTRVAIDFYFAAQGGICKVIQPRTTCIISLKQTDLTEDLKDLNNVITQATHDDSQSWLNWLLDFGWIKSLLALGGVIIALLLITCL